MFAFQSKKQGGSERKMGQLIKLQDYVSRYENNIYFYPSRFVKLKKQQWIKIKNLWENNLLVNETMENNTFNWLDEEEEKEPLIHRIKGLFKFRKKTEEQDNIDETEESANKEEHDEIVSSIEFNPTLLYQPETIEELKRNFLDQLFRFQMKWASTTLTEKSSVDNRYYFDERLKYFLQRFPDTFLLLYEPIFLLKKAPVETDTILITPTDVWIISFLEQEKQAVFLGSGERFWMKRYKEKEEKILSPLLSLNRTESIVKNILELYKVDIPIRKMVLCRNGYIDFPNPPFDVHLVEKRNYEKWFQMMRNSHSPLKHIQLKAAKALLDYAQTTSYRRLEWETDTDSEQ